MYTVVLDQSRMISECLAADFTLIWSLTGVYTVVLDQIIMMSERLAADITAVRPLPRVPQTMNYQTASVVGRVLAPLTLVSAVPADMVVPRLNVSVQTILSQTAVVAVRTSNSFCVTWGQYRHMFTLW